MDLSDRVLAISRSLQEVRERIEAATIKAGRKKSEVTLIAVTKTYPVSDVEILHNLGVTNFAENRDSEGAGKSILVSARWHFQGQIQSNKIKSISSWADAIHSFDNSRHVQLVERAISSDRNNDRNNDKKIEAFIQVSLSRDPGRGGVSVVELDSLAEVILSTKNLQLLGIMAVAPVGEAPDQAFERLSRIYLDFKAKFPSAPYLSAGMSGDFESAILHGATHVRIGSSILGSRSVER